MEFWSKGTGHIVFDGLCLAMGALAALEIVRGLWLVQKWARGELDARPYQNRIFLWRAKIAFGILALGLFWCAPIEVGIFGAVAGILLITSVVISRNKFLQRFKPIRIMRGMRLIAGVAAAMVGGSDLLLR